jgi:hypothetical protein
MKSCPACNRTFEDSFTFCLVDGSILSAPFDLQATPRAPELSRPEPPPTEVLQIEEVTKQEIPPAIAGPRAAQKPPELDSTIAASIPIVEPQQLSASPIQPARNSTRSPVLMIGAGALVIIGLIFFITNRSGSTNENAVNKNIATAIPTPSVVTNVSNSNLPIMSPMDSGSPPEINLDLEGTIWEGTQNDVYVRVYEFKAGGKVIEKISGKVGENLPMTSYPGSWTLQGNRVSMKFAEAKNTAGRKIEARILGIGYTEMTGEVTWEGNSYVRDTILVKRKN